VPTASIRLALAPRALGPVALAITVSTSRPTDAATGNVQGQLAQAAVRDEAVVTATHDLNLSNRARGTVVFTNASQAPVPIPELTVVATPDGIRFLTQDAIQSIPPGATAPVEVRAEAQGDAGNVPADTITVIVEPAIAAQLGQGGGVTNPEPTRDGQTEATKVFGQDDYDRAVQELAAKLEAGLGDAVPDVAEGVVAFPGTAQRFGDVEVDQPAAAIVGVQGEQTTITGSLAANVLTASETQIEDVARQMLAAAAAPDSVVPDPVITLGEPTIANGEARYDAIGEALVYGLRVGEDVLREQVRSKTIPEAQRILGQYGTATITLSPDWLPALPDDPNRIEIETGPPPPGATPAPMTSPTPSTGPMTSPVASGVPVSPSVPASAAPVRSGAPGPSSAPVPSA
jgi:hypothetical protein